MFRHSKVIQTFIEVSLLVIFLKKFNLKTLWGWLLLSSLGREGDWGSQSLNEPNISSSYLYVRKILLASCSLTIALNIISSRCKYSEGHNLAKSRFPIFPHDILHTRKHLSVWLHRLLSFETNKSQPVRKCTNIHQRQSCSRCVKLSMSLQYTMKKNSPSRIHEPYNLTCESCKCQILTKRHFMGKVWGWTLLKKVKNFTEINSIRRATNLGRANMSCSKLSDFFCLCSGVQKQQSLQV